ncbi:hypothetical protein P9112_011411 [Eukaryota sp. TZLM1-RC]
MGNEGGSVPKRRELVKTKSPHQLNPQQRVLVCALSATELCTENAICICKLGYVFNKEVVLQAMIDKDPVLREGYPHIRRLKDLRDIHPTPSSLQPGFDNESDFMCPITKVPLTDSNKFVALFGCGCVVSKGCLSNLGSSICPKCQTKIVDMIPVFPDEDERSQLIEEIMAKKRSVK